MSTLSFELRCKYDLKIKDDEFPLRKGQTIDPKAEPLGKTKIIVGDIGEIKDRLCKEIDRIAEKLEELYYGEE